MNELPVEQTAPAADSASGLDRRQMALLWAALISGGGALAQAGPALAAKGHTLTISFDGQAHDFGIPDTINGNRVKRDAELLVQLFDKHPEAIPAIYDAVLKGDVASANKTVMSVGLTEEAFTAEGGGLWHLLILLAAAAYAYWKSHH